MEVCKCWGFPYLQFQVSMRSRNAPPTDTGTPCIKVTAQSYSNSPCLFSHAIRLCIASCSVGTSWRCRPGKGTCAPLPGSKHLLPWKVYSYLCQQFSGTNASGPRQVDRSQERLGYIHLFLQPVLEITTNSQCQELQQRPLEVAPHCLQQQLDCALWR